MKFAALTRLERNAHRVGEIITVLAKYGLADWFKGWHYSWIQDRIRTLDGQHIPALKLEERVRLAFTDLGTTFIKLGQVLSTRPDLVGPELARELARLQDSHPRRSIRNRAGQAVGGQATIAVVSIQPANSDLKFWPRRGSVRV
jgi:ubiquinone biosynthesis protein